MTSPLVGLGYPYQAPTGGASHAQDWTWPDPGSVAGGVSTNARSRGSSSIIGTTVFSGGTTAGSTIANYLGTDCSQFFNGTDATSFAGQQYDGVLPMHLRAGGDGNDYVSPSISDQMVYRYICRMAKFPGINPLTDGNHDYGFQVKRCSGLAGGVFQNTLPGWFVQLKNDTTATVGVRGANGVISQDVAVNTTVFNTYEWRFINGTKTQFAQVQLLINEQPAPLPALTASYGPGTNNPATTLLSGRQAFGAYVCCFPGVASTNLSIAEVRMISASDLVSAL